ncbi:VWA domain-containing protein [Paenibacillus sp. J5C_2022]|uniref:VWA domain-containing protein n=1 Tax=Paenibacillus sp. J5C2022 TaxID=2977129 RepID=UPI0021D0391E|nr:VWA domain-containing protein [Paenibacillus sp. J5C2022]MCU6707206.1 VWA domain-containing protein [Paenibacillus sp. J5C2022]
MGIELSSPPAMLLLLPCLLLIWWMLRGTLRLRGSRKIAVIATRSIILGLLVAMAAGIHPYKLLQHRQVVIVADRSASMEDEAGLEQWIAEAWSSKEEEDVGAVVAFGANAIIDSIQSAQSEADHGRYEFIAKPNPSFTDMAAGMRHAAALLQGYGGGRIVLVTDGKENSGDARREARLLKDAGIPVDVYHWPSGGGSDAAIEALKLPAVMKEGESFSFQISIRSTFSGMAELKLYEGNKEVGVSGVQLERGDNLFSLRGVASEAGFHTYRAELYAEADGQAANNTAHAFSRITGPGTVLIVEGEPGSSGNVEAALAASFIRTETISPEQLPLELTDYAAYDSIVLNNVPATRISEKPMRWLDSAVADFGIGMVMLGGDSSFGLGGYFDTPIERALPVYMDLQGRKQMPTLGLTLIIDRSGSMSGTSLELAKEAAMRTVELMREEDTVGVIAFDSSPWWVVEPTRLQDKESVLSAIQGIGADGGTDIYKALQSGFEGLLKVEAQRRHMILLTDGQSATSTPYSTITNGMKENGVTLSTVAVGQGADKRLLEELASAGAGRYYYTEDQSTIPAIFSRETVLISRTYVVEGAIAPIAGSAGDWGRLWKDGVPQLQAYIATTPKELAEVALWSSEEDPLLARWSYGAGKTVAWTSDSAGKWSRDWVLWSSYPDVLTEWVKWTFPQFQHAPYQIETRLRGEAAELTVTSTTGHSPSMNGTLAVRIREHSGNERTIGLSPAGLGQFRGELPSAEPGAYLAGIGSVNGEAFTGGTTAGFVIPYSPEYRIGDDEGEGLLHAVASLTGGRVIQSAEEVFRFQPPAIRKPYDWTREMLIAVLLLWLLDIALRRLSIPWTGWASLLHRAMFRKENRMTVRQTTVDSQHVLSRLQERKGKRSSFLSGGHEGDEGHVRLRDGVKDAPIPSGGLIGDQLDNKGGRASVEQENAQSATVSRLLAAKKKNRR